MKSHNSAQSFLDNLTDQLQTKDLLLHLFTTITVQLTKGKMKAYSLPIIVIFT